MRIKLICDLCKKELPNFKKLLDHYNEAHPGVLKRYKIINKPKGVTLISHAPNPEILIDKEHWEPEDCTIKEIE